MRRLLPTVLLGFAALVLAGWALGALVDGPVAELDRDVMRWVSARRTGALNAVMRALTHLGDAWAVTLVLSATSVLAGRARSGRLGALAMLAVPGALLLAGTIKRLVERPRPGLDPVVEVGGFSFPSGHATAAAICYLTVALVLSRLRPATRRLAFPAAVVVALVVAATRVYLGVHWPSDVTAGLVLGAAWVAVCRYAVFGGRERGAPALSS